MAALRDEGPHIEAAAKMMAECIAAGGIVHVFGSGHSHMMAEEVFHRAGGLFAFNAMLDINLTSFGTLKAGMVERTEGYAKVILASFDVRPGEVVVVVSNSGINPVPIELAIEARNDRREGDRRHLGRNYRLGGVASLVGQEAGGCGRPDRRQPGAGRRRHSVARWPRRAGGGGVDRARGGADERHGGANRGRAARQGQQPPVIVSMNVPGGDERNAELTERYRPRLQLLKA